MSLSISYTLNHVLYLLPELVQEAHFLRTRCIAPVEFSNSTHSSHLYAQVFDWLKETNPDLPPVTERTVYNFVMFLRMEHNIIKIEIIPLGK